MRITQEQLTQLSRIYNTFLTVSTCGEDTMIMGDCLRALQRIILDIDRNNMEENAPLTSNEIVREE